MRFFIGSVVGFFLVKRWKVFLQMRLYYKSNIQIALKHTDSVGVLFCLYLEKHTFGINTFCV
jgi:hypothetical protein